MVQYAFKFDADISFNEWASEKKFTMGTRKYIKVKAKNVHII